MSGSDHHHSGSDDESVKPGLLVKKKKKSEKPGYKMFEADDSDSEPVLYDDSNKGPVSKLKKHSKPSFKFSGKIKLKEKEKDEKKDNVDKKDEKEPKRLTIRKMRDKDGKDKEHKHRKKKDKNLHGKPQLTSVPAMVVEAESPVFGVALPVAVERTPSHDGVKLPVVVRECIDYIEEHGLLYEGIYRISGVKSKVLMLRDAYNRRQASHLYEHDPSIVASLLKQFLRDLTEPVLTFEIMQKFEQASVIQEKNERLYMLRECIEMLPPCNKELLSWMIVHMTHVIAKEKINKMSIQNVSIVLSPTMRISHRVLNVLFLHSQELFSHVKIIRYRPPLQPAASKWSVDLPETEEGVQEELNKQESLLIQLHQELSSHHHSAGISADKEDRVWEVQRNVTQLKRKLKLIAKTNAARELEKQQLSSEPVKRSDPHRRSINAAELNFALSTGSLKKNIRASQVELASTPSVTTSSEALAIAGSTGHLSAVGSVGHVPAAGSAGHLVSASSAGHLAVHTPRKSSQSQRSSGLSDSQPTPNRAEVSAEAAELERTHVPPPSDLDLSDLQSDTTESAVDTTAIESPLSPQARVPSLNLEPQSPEDENAQTLTEQKFSHLTLQQKLSQTEGIDVVLGGEMMKTSTSQDSDVTLSAYAEGGVTGSLSQQSLSDYKPITEGDQLPSIVTTVDTNMQEVVIEAPVMTESAESVETLPAAPGEDQSIDLTLTTQDHQITNTAKLEQQLPVSDQQEQTHQEPSVTGMPFNQPREGDISESVAISGQTAASGQAAVEQSPTEALSALLIPEKLHRGVALSPRGDTGNAVLDDTEQAITGYKIDDDDELRELIAEEAQLIWEEEELIAIKDELKQKIATEMIEIDRMNEEIVEYEELRSITTLGHSSEAMSSDEYYSSTSDTDPEDDEAAMREIDSLAAELQAMTDKNSEWEAQNIDLVHKIDEERMGCVNVKIQIRLLQQQMLGSQIQEQSLI